MSGFTGTIRLVRLALRRDRITLPVWILGMAAFLSATTAMFADSSDQISDDVLEAIVIPAGAAASIAA